MNNNRIIILTLILLLSIFYSLTAQTGKSQYIIRTEQSGSELGEITIELFPAIAPLHSAYFDSLVNISFYDSIAFHRVVPDFVIQGGDPNSLHGPRETWGEGDPAQSTILAEFSGVSHLRGIIGAARDEDINSANSQFYINVADNEFLDSNYTAYGRVIEGMDVVDAIVNVPRDANDNPLEKIEMFVTKGNHTNDIPEVPVPVFPPDARGGLLISDSLIWNPVEGVVQYNIQISESAGFDSLYIDSKVGKPYYIIQNLKLGNVQYYWRVRSNNGGNISGYSDAKYFYSSIEATELVYPESNEQDVSITPEFEWQPVEGATRYRLEIATAPTFPENRIVYDVDTITTTQHTPPPLEPNRSHYWRVYSMTDEYEGPKSDFRRFVTEEVTSIGYGTELPQVYMLNQNYPNPFNPSTTIHFELPFSSRVSLEIYNVLGQKVSQLINGEMAAGYHEIKWDASSQTSGIYIYSLKAIPEDKLTNFYSVNKMLLLR